MYHPVGASNPSTLKNQNGVIAGLKNELRELRESKSKLLTELTALRKSAKVTRYREVEVENQ